MVDARPRFRARPSLNRSYTDQAIIVSKMDRGRRSSLEEDFYDDEDLQSSVSTGPTLRDQENMMQDLKKENFDLKLRLYMQEKNNASTSSRASEYETSMAEMLEKLEQALSENERLNSEMKETRVRERALITKQKRLELKCAEQNEQIHTLYASVQNLHTVHSTPIRASQSEYNVQRLSNVDIEVSDDEKRPLSPIDGYERSFSDAGVYPDKTQSLPGQNTYSNSQTTNYYSYDIRDGNTNNPRTEDNIVIVPPNNSRIRNDMVPIGDPAPTKKKKKKGLMKLFGMCTGKSSET